MQYFKRCQVQYKPRFPASAVILVLFVLVTCDLDSVTESSRETVTYIPGEGGSRQWLIPEDEILDVLGKDAIPSIDKPAYLPATDVDFVDDNRLIAGVNKTGIIYGYPHQILDWHEIVNGEIGNQAFTMLYCPLTGTATGWSRRTETGRNLSDFGVSGKLFRNNLIAYERRSGSYFSQMQLRGVQGEFGGTDIQIYQVIETTWETWKKLYPHSRVLTTKTGFDRNYSGFAYGNYHLDHNTLLFPVARQDDRLQNKVRVHGIIDSETADMDATVKLFEIRQFGSGVNLVTDRVGDHDYLVAGSSDLNFAAAFRLEEGNGAALQFEPLQGQLPVIMEDNEGNRWDLFGFATRGPRKGERLEPARSYTGYWFAWADFFPGVEIYEFE